MATLSIKGLMFLSFHDGRW